MIPSILVTGGTGTIGSSTVPRLRDAGRDIRILTRHPREDSDGVEHVEGDTVSGRGVAEAVRGVQVVLHLAGGARGDDVAARRIAEAAREAGVEHLVLISVIGADQMPIGYFRAKAAAEVAVAKSGVPWTVLRAAQLHDFVLPVARFAARMPFRPSPRGLRFEPVGRDEVASRLAEIALGDPAGRVADLAGPEVLTLAELASAYAGATGRRVRREVGFRMPGSAGRSYRAGENLAGPDATRGRQTFAGALESDERLAVRLPG